MRSGARSKTSPDRSRPPAPGGQGGPRRLERALAERARGFLRPWRPLALGAVAILVAVVLGRALKLIAARLGERRPNEERELKQLRTRETAIVLVATAIPYAT